MLATLFLPNLRDPLLLWLINTIARQVKIMPLRNNDIAMVHVKKIKQFLRLLAPINNAPSPIKYFLSNGDIEKQLKLFIGAAWEKGDPTTRAFVMDKKFKDDDAPKEELCEIDFLAFQKRPSRSPRPCFWIEAKCGFASAQHSSMEKGPTVTTAKDAVRQVTRAIINLPVTTHPFPQAVGRKERVGWRRGDYIRGLPWSAGSW